MIGWFVISKICNKCSLYFGKFIRNDIFDIELKELDEDFKIILENIFLIVNFKMKIFLKF